MMEDCPICLEQMNRVDCDHPIQCKTERCDYNFCFHCIESLITSSKDDFMEASDGNLHVKVHLHCPNCRSDLSTSIRDTLLLRKTDAVLHSKCLTERQERWAKAMTDPTVMKAIRDARATERKFLGIRASGRHSFCFSDDEDEEEPHEFEEMGVEIELLRGVHSSFRMPRAPKHRLAETQQRRISRADTSLLSGLELLMSETEQLELCESMISGDPSQLARAAKVLHHVLQDEEGGLRIQQRRQSAAQKRRGYARKSSVFALIDEQRKVHQDPCVQAAIQVGRRNNNTNNVQAYKASMEALREFPLPVRMPKYVELSLESFSLELCDYTWDGTVMDAYNKISIGSHGFGRGPVAVHQNQTKNAGVRRILGGTEVRIEMPGEARVIVSAISREAGRQGVTKGDVLSHIQGKCVSGLSHDRVMQELKELAQMGLSQVSIVFNADRAVAEALSRRADAMLQKKNQNAIKSMNL